MIRDGKLLEALSLTRCASRVKRFHTMPLIGDNTVGQHTFNLIGILCAVVPPQVLRPQLLQAAFLHDVPEAVTGDVPSPTKRSAPGLKQACDAFEAKVLDDAGIVDMSGYLHGYEEQWLTLADSLEGWLFCIEEMQMGNTLLAPAAENFRSYVLEKMKALKPDDMVTYVLAAYKNFGKIISAAQDAHAKLEGK